VTLLELKIGQQAVVVNKSIDNLPLKLIEFGCLPGNSIEVVQFAPFQDPIYIKVNDVFVAIRKDVGQLIEVSPIQS